MLTEFQEKKLAALADKNGAEVRGWEPGSPEIEVLKSQLISRWHTMQEAADTNRDKQISRSEWLAYIDKMLSSPATYDTKLKSLG